MKNIAIITARGGSKRVPGKNIKNFLGKPIMAYGIEAALQSGLYDEVMVSTDSEEIAEIAVKYGAKVPFYRSAATSDDYATTKDVLVEVLGEYKARGQEFDLTTCIYPCAPFVTAQKLRDAVKLMEEGDADSTVVVTPYGHPIQRAITIVDGSAEFKFPEYNNTRRTQDLETCYHDCGQFYVFRTQVYLGNQPGTGKRVPIIVPETEVQDIDTIDDWNLAELKYERYIK